MSTHAVPMAVYAGQSKAKRERQLANTPGRWLQNALSSGGIMFIAGGMDMTLGLGWNQNTRIETTAHFQFCWFIAAIVGALLAAPFIGMLSKRFYMRCSSLLVTISGIIYLSAPTTYGAVIAARYINGLAIGWTTVAFIVHASEIAFSKYRGFCLALEQFATSIGIAIQVVYSSQWPPNIAFAANRLHGILLLVFGLCAFGFTWCIIESPIFHIRNNRETAALECQQRLLRAANVNDLTLFTLEDNKNYVLENENRTIVECLVEGLLPGIKLLLMRIFVAFSFSLPLSVAQLGSSLLALGHLNGWPAILFGVMRMIGAAIALYLLDNLGRKLLTLCSLGLMAVMSLAIGGIFSRIVNISNDYDMAVACTLTLIHQIFAGFYVPNTSVYLGEAFPMRIKPHLIACCLTWQYLVHLIVICTFTSTSYNIYAYLVAVGVLMLVACLAFGVLLPETRRMTLREAQDRFRRFYDCKFY